MADSYNFIGQMMLVGFNFNPLSWQLANGQLLSISQNTALFSLLGTYYGGNGTTTFALPNMQGNVAMGFGTGLSNYDIGETGGTQAVTLLTSNVPSHSHTPMAATARSAVDAPAGGSFSNSESGNVYSASTSPLTQLNSSIINSYGNGQSHNNMMPYLGMYWIICMAGIFPPRS